MKLLTKSDTATPPYDIIEKRLIRRAAYYMSRMEQAPNQAGEFFGARILTCKGVFNPTVSKSSAQFASWVAISARNRRVLDVGTGTGVLGLVAAANGAKSVLMTDSNPLAVACASRNIAENSIENAASVRVVQAESLESIRGKYDLVLFAAPYLWFPAPYSVCGKYHSLVDSMFDPDDKAKYNVINGAVRLLSPKGLLALQVGSMSRITLIEQWAKDKDLVLRDVLNGPDGRARNVLRVYAPSQ